MTFRFFVVTHNILPKETLENVSFENIKNHIIIYGVSPIHRFLINTNNYIENSSGITTILENKLPYYDPLMQYNCFDENSAIYHIFHNENYMFFEHLDFIGFSQYDMKLDSFFQHIQTTIEASENKDTLLMYYHKTENNAIIELAQVIGEGGWNIIIDMYNKEYNTNYSWETVLMNDIYLYNTYLLPRPFFKKMADFSLKVSKVLFLLCGSTVRYISFMLERFHGIYITLKVLEGELKSPVKFIGIGHSDELKAIKKEEFDKILLIGDKPVNTIDSRKRALIWDNLYHGSAP